MQLGNLSGGGNQESADGTLHDNFSAGDSLFNVESLGAVETESYESALPGFINPESGIYILEIDPESTDFRNAVRIIGEGATKRPILSINYNIRYVHELENKQASAQDQLDLVVQQPVFFPNDTTEKGSQAFNRAISNLKGMTEKILGRSVDGTVAEILRLQSNAWFLAQVKTAPMGKEKQERSVIQWNNVRPLSEDERAQIAATTNTGQQAADPAAA